MSDIKLIYIGLKTIQICSMFVISFWVAKSSTEKTYWKRSIFLILIWTLIDGLRFGRDQDYNSYYPRFTEMCTGNNSEGYEYLFYYICRIFGILNLPYWSFIFTGSFLLIFSCIWLFKDYRKYLPFIIILMFWDLGQYDNLIRFYWAFPFFAMSIYYRIHDRPLLSFLLLLCSIYTHNGYWLVMPIIVFYNYLNKKSLPPQLLTISYLLILLFGNLGLLNFIGEYAPYLNIFGSSKISSYADIADTIVSGNFGYNAGNDLMRNITTTIRLIIAYTPAIFWGRNAIQKFKGGIFIYNIFIIGVLTMPLFQLVEILDRLNSLFLFFSCIVNGIMIGTVYYNRKYVKKYILVICFCSLISSVLPSFSVLSKRTKDNYMLFLWDANGREYMPMNIYPMFEK